jgi:hypothetical protein
VDLGYSDQLAESPADCGGLPRPDPQPYPRDLILTLAGRPDPHLCPRPPATAKPGGLPRTQNPEPAVCGFVAILCIVTLNCGAGGIRTHTVRHLKPVPPGQLGYGPFLFASLPANVGVCEWQFGQRKRRFPFLLSSQFPLM